MDRVDQVAAALEQAGVGTLRIERASDAQLKVARQDQPEPVPALYTWLAQATRPSDEAGAAVVVPAPTREDIAAAGISLHTSTVDRAEYAVIPPGEAVRCYIVAKVHEGGAAVVAESLTEAGAARMLSAYLDGPIQREPDA